MAQWGRAFFFHPDNGFLYWSDGDDTDAALNSQHIDANLFSGLFRIDVNKIGGNVSHPIRRQPLNGATANYFIPNDNPFSGQDGTLEEYFAVGLRNPHRATLDSVTGRIFIGDVGDVTKEEIDIMEPNESGLNFQWPLFEGWGGDLPAPYIGTNKRPFLDFSHSEGLAVIGGYVYRGTEFAQELGGKYIFGDCVYRKIWMMDDTTDPPGKQLLCIMPPGDGPDYGSSYVGLSSFGEDAHHELYFCQLSSVGANLFKLARNSQAPTVKPFPALLSETGIFQNLAQLNPSPGMLAYEVNSPLWSDGAVKQRWAAIPSNEQIHFSARDHWQFPAGSVFVKHFELGTDDNHSEIHQRIETRVLVIGGNGLPFGATYKWRQDQTDADLLLDGGNQDIAISTSTGVRTQKWVFPSRNDCLRCHTAPSGYVLGVNTRQLNRDHLFPETGNSDNQIRAWNHAGLFDQTLNENDILDLPRMAAITNLSATLDTRVRSYLDANCAHCHQPGGVRAFWDARFDTPLEDTGIVNGYVSQSLGISGAKAVVPHHLEQSILYQRLNGLGTIQMPPLAKMVVDTNAVNALAEWIGTLDDQNSDVPAPFASLDLGFAPIPGTTARVNGQIFSSSAGGDIWTTADAFRYVYTTLDGDGEMTVRLVSTTTPTVKGGLMIRESLTAGSRHATVAIIPQGGSGFQWRLETDGESDYTPSSIVDTPCWLRLRRSGAELIGFASTNSVDWVEVGRKTFAFPNRVYIGMVTASRVPGISYSSSFDQIQTSGGISNVAPFVTLTASSQQTSYSAASNLHFRASASDFDGSITKVQFLDNDSILAELSAPPYEFGMNGMRSGEHSVYARAIDNLGASTDSSPINFSVEGVEEPAPDITLSTANLSVPTGGSFTISASVENAIPLGYQWFLDGFPILEATQNFYSVPAVSLQDAGEYSVGVNYSGGTSLSAALTLDVTPPPIAAPIIAQSPTNITLAIGELATFVVAATGENLQYQWQHNGSNVLFGTSAKLQIRNTQLSDTGIYTVKVSNAYGTVQSNPAVLSVLKINVFAGLTIAGPVGSKYRIDFRSAVETLHLDRPRDHHPRRDALPLHRSPVARSSSALLSRHSFALTLFSLLNLFDSTMNTSISTFR